MDSDIELAIVQLCVEAALSQEGPVVSLLNDVTVLWVYDYIAKGVRAVANLIRNRKNNRREE